MPRRLLCRAARHDCGYADIGIIAQDDIQQRPDQAAGDDRFGRPACVRARRVDGVVVRRRELLGDRPARRVAAGVGVGA
jgi:hypothetical protein